jgi:hypothetical protein
MANNSVHILSYTGASFQGSSSSSGSTTPVGEATATEITDAQFVANGDGQYIDYTVNADGTKSWSPHALHLTLPTSAYARGIFVTVQKGTLNGAIWTPAADKEGANESSFYTGRMIYAAEMSSSTRWNTLTVPGAEMKSSGVYPANSATCRTFRYSLYVISTQNGALDSTVVRQTTAWAGADHFDLAPDNHPATLDGTLLKNATVYANAMAANAVTAANGALAANAVVDSNVANVGVAKLIYGTTIFAGDVYLSRGSGNPVIALTNAGLYLYGVASGSNGLTSSPYVVIQSTGIGLYADASSRSLTLSSGAVTLWYVNGSTTDPYLQLQSTGLTAVSGSYTLTATSSQIKMAYGTAASATLNSSGFTIVSGSYTLQTIATGIFLTYGASCSLTLAATGIVVVAGSNCLTLTASSLQLAYGSASAVNILSTGVEIIAPSSKIQLGSGAGYSNAAIFTCNGTSTYIAGNSILTGTFSCTSLSVDGPVYFFGDSPASSAGAASGYYLIVNVGNIPYKIALLNS